MQQESNINYVVENVERENIALHNICGISMNDYQHSIDFRLKSGYLYVKEKYVV